MTSLASSSDAGSIPISYVNILQTLFVFLRLTTVSRQGVIERKLLNDLFNGTSYNKLERPVWNDSEALVVQFGLTLQQIIDVDEKNQILISNIWLDLMWNDYNLVWNESEYGGIKSIRIPPANIWKPDIYMYNSADEDIDSTFPTNVVVSSNGQCQWVPPGLFLSTCKIDITWFPFDDQQCKMKFGSWTYDSSGIDLQPKNENGDISSFIPNGEWELLGVPAVRTAFQYDCCPEQYIDITYTVRIQRRKLYYIFNLVVPCLMMSCLSLLVFSMPPDAGEKITCGVTILLSLTVFLQLVAETMPPTSDAVPLIGMYFACIMLMCSLSMVFTVLVLNYHHRTPDTHEMPEWVKTIICGWLAHLVRVARPTNTSDFMASPERPKLKKTSTHTSKSSRLTAELLQQRSSRSLLANVLDLQDDLLAFNLTRVKVVDSADQTNNVVDESWNISRQAVNGNPVCASGEAKDEEEEVTWRVSESIPAAGSVGGSTCQQLQTAECSLLVDVLNEVRFLTGRMKQDASLQQVCNDWKFAAMVIDRVCLWMFSIFTLVSTGAILLSAPHVLV